MKKLIALVLVLLLALAVPILAALASSTGPPEDATLSTNNAGTIYAAERRAVEVPSYAAAIATTVRAKIVAFLVVAAVLVAGAGCYAYFAVFDPNDNAMRSCGPKKIYKLNRGGTLLTGPPAPKRGQRYFGTYAMV